MKSFKIGVLRETKIPPDRRVALPPDRVEMLLKSYPQLSIVVQPSDLRCFKDQEYLDLGITVQEDLSDCDLLIGVKEVDIDAILPDKSYIFFAHVAKEQPYNRDLLKAILEKNIDLMDYEYFTTMEGQRLIAFGRWAGIVGAYNALRGWGIHSEGFNLRPAHQCHDHLDLKEELKNANLRNARILVSGGGRVASGAMETLSVLNIREVTPVDFLIKEFDEAVVCRIDPEHYAKHSEGKAFQIQHFFDHPNEYQPAALQYLKKTDIYIAAHYWDPESPRMFELADLENIFSQMEQSDSQLEAQYTGTADRFPSVIADISCDINGSVPTTTRATTIADPYYYYDQKRRLLMMTVDNLPGELPRDASLEFSHILAKEIIPRILQGDPDGVIERATITKKGALTELFSYLENYSKGL
jgi:saccharopine dehydrogenase (NAD+, L-lysine-forming)